MEKGFLPFEEMEESVKYKITPTLKEMLESMFEKLGTVSVEQQVAELHKETENNETN